MFIKNSFHHLNPIHYNTNTLKWLDVSSSKEKETSKISFSFPFKGTHSDRNVIVDRPRCDMKERPAKRNKRVRKAQVISTRNTVEEGESSEEFDEGRKGNGMTMEYQSTHPMDIATTMRGELDHDMNSEEGHESMGGLGDFSPVFSFLSAQSRRIKAEEPRPSNDTSECMAGAPGESIATPSASTLPELAPHSSPSALPAATKKARSSTRHRFSSSVPIPTYTDSDLPLKTSNDDLILNYDSVPSPSNITPNHRDTSHHAPADASTSGTRELKMESITEAERQLDLPLARASYGRKIVEDQATAESTVGFLESLRAQALASVNVTSTSKSVYVRPIKSSYERPITTPLKGSNLVAAFPLSAVAKGRSLPKKLELALPEDESLFENSARLYSPAMLSNTGVIPVGSGPTESTLYGFWPAPPPLNTGELWIHAPFVDSCLNHDSSSGKGLYPAPLIRQEEMTAVENDHRPRVEIFVDNSNIMYSFLNWLRTRPEVQLSSYDGTTANSGVQGKLKLAQLITIGGKKVRMDYTTLFAILERGRKVERRVLVGSSPLWQGLDSAIEWVSSLTSPHPSRC